MKWVLWTVCAVLALLWTGMVALGAQLSEWLAAAVTHGQATELARQAGAWPLPGWLALWVDPAWLVPLQQLWADTFAWLTQVLPTTAGWAGTLLSWVAPLLWLVWAVVLALMLVLAGGLHWWMARRTASMAGH